MQMRVHDNYKQLLNLGGQTALLVDNDILALREEFKLLASYGLKITLARTLSEAQALTAEHVYDIIVIDVTLPDGSGLPFLRSTKMRPEFKYCTVVSTSAFKNTGIRQRSFEMGADAFFEKPLCPNAFSRRMRLLRA